MKKHYLLFAILLFIVRLTAAQTQTISFSGTVYDDPTESTTSGTPVNTIGGKQLYAVLATLPTYWDSYDSQVLTSVPVASDGTYSFSNVPARVRVSLATEMGVVGAYPPTSILPNAIRSKAVDEHNQRDYGLDYITSSGITDQATINFYFNQLPFANSVTVPSQLNPNDGTTQVPIPTLTGSDPEDGIYDGVTKSTKIAITSFPNNATLVYDNKPFTAQDAQLSYYCNPGCQFYIIDNYDPAKLTIRPTPGSSIVSFQYRLADVAGRWSSIGTVTMPFVSPTANYDYGDIPAALENASSPARHLVVNGLHLGYVIDYETGPLNSPKANGDDTNNYPNDEDGIYYPNPTLSSTSQSFSLTVRVLNSLNQPATLSGWADFNNNGVFEASERAQITVTSSATNKEVVLVWNNLPALTPGNFGLRLRLASNASDVDTPYGIASSGEVEDYLVTVYPRISGRVFSDGNAMTDGIVNGTPWQNQFPIQVNAITFNKNGPYVSYLATVASDGTFSFDAPSDNMPYNLLLTRDYGILMPMTGAHVGNGPGNDLTTYDGSIYLPLTVNNANVVDVNFGINQNPTANNVTSASQENPLGTNQVQVPTLTGSDPEDGIYNGISGTNTVRIYYNPNTGFEPISGTLYYDGNPVTSGQIITNYNPDKLTVDPLDGNVTVQFQYKQIDAAGLESPFPGVVTMPFSDTISQLDFGDARENYFTSLNYVNGPRHTIVDGLRLGSLIDAEANGQFSGGQFDQTATGDNINGIDDEDGVAAFPTLQAYQTAYSLTVKLTNTTGTDATLSGWIDFNRDYQFTTNERAQLTVPSGATSVTLTWTNILWTGSTSSEGPIGNSFARFRLASVADEVDNVTGQANSGEVEDYALTIEKNPMPVNLTHFEGRWLENQGNLLSWNTAWERDNDHFEIQRSADAKSFERIGRVSGQGTTTQSQSYSFVDAQPLADVTYYRLKQIDLDGKLSYLAIIAIRRGLEAGTTQLLLYPNPTTDLVYLQVDKPHTIIEASVYSVTGRLVLQQEKPDLPLSVRDLPAGIYIVEVRLSTGQVLHQRFVRQ